MEVEVQVLLSSRLEVSDGVQLRHRNQPTSPRAGRRGGEGQGGGGRRGGKGRRSVVVVESEGGGGVAGDGGEGEGLGDLTVQVGTVYVMPLT